MTQIIFEIANDIPLSDIELLINDIDEKYKPIIHSGKLIVGDTRK